MFIILFPFQVRPAIVTAPISNRDVPGGILTAPGIKPKRRNDQVLHGIAFSSRLNRERALLKREGVMCIYCCQGMLLEVSKKMTFFVLDTQLTVALPEQGNAPAPPVLIKLKKIKPNQIKIPNLNPFTPPPRNEDRSGRPGRQECSSPSSPGHCHGSNKQPGRFWGPESTRQSAKKYSHSLGNHL